jgi:7,8-dihydropterin-6-yl-methyl-4-(beta-D-ribofuranosyl)aminobenzene 5'-phosphate synthase
MRKGYTILLSLMISLLASCATSATAPGPASTPKPILPEVPSPDAIPYIEFLLTIVYDNNQYNQDLVAKWGFSCLVEGLEETILFDTGGDSDTLLYNMRQLNIEPEEVDAVVLSHIHSDHVGGLSGLLKENSNVVVYLPQSFPESFKRDVRSAGAEVVEVSEPAELLNGVYTTGELGNATREQSLILVSREGLIVITGCAHPGVVNIIRKAKDVAEEDKVHLVVGGFHLVGAATSCIQSIVGEFRQQAVQKVAPCHCSGDEARELFRQEYGEDYIESGVGMRIAVP